MKKHMPQVGLIAIWYRASNQVARFVDNLRALQYPCLQPVFVIHAMSPEYRVWLKHHVPEAIFIEPGENLGPASGWNLGIRCLLGLNCAYIGIWNVDVGLHPECIHKLVEVLENDPSIGAVSPVLFYSDDPGTVQMYGGSIDSLARTELEFNGAGDISLLPELYEAGYLDGGTLLVRASELRQIGGFDEALFMYYEDCDLCKRIQKAGSRTVAVRGAAAWHYQREIKGIFAPRYEYFYRTRNQFYMVKKHGRARDGWKLLAWVTFYQAPRVIYFHLKRRELKRTAAYLHGFLSGLCGWMGKRGWVES